MVRNASNDLTFDSVEPPVDIQLLGFEVFQVQLQKKTSTVSIDTQRCDFRLLEDKAYFCTLKCKFTTITAGSGQNDF
jgi:hypothetical protein